MDIGRTVQAVWKLESARIIAGLTHLLHDVGRPVVLQGTIDALAHRTKEPLPGALLASMKRSPPAAAPSRK